ncbi:hypothetical protein IGI04_031830 [Brassica rapa subsp. trilocularis]|uniref:Zinc finger GRF-type domain-containing protein n=1 Tax=Brassica rapa subsp. trilocularis TaxID=1813537 RepID=A0ABQ7LUP8_BRACM|nr:hypothetical protein IGI04_031830 [Brassica rapa subsp. trilocularis]
MRASLLVSLRATPLRVLNRFMGSSFEAFWIKINEKLGLIWRPAYYLGHALERGERIISLIFARKLGFALCGDFICDAELSPIFSPFLDRFGAGLSPPGPEMDPADERTDCKRKLEHITPECACGGRMIHEVRVKDEFDTQPGKRFFSCVNYEADGLHYRQPWVCGVQEEIEMLRKRVEEADEVIKSVPMLVESVEAQVKRLSLLLDKLTGDVYNLTVQVAALERLN